MWRILICTLVLLQQISAQVEDDDYVEQSRQSCVKTRNSLSCGKYKILKYIRQISEPTQAVTLGSLGPISIVTLPRASPAPPVFSSSEPRSVKSEWDKLHRFALKELDNFVSHHGVTIQVGGSEFGDDSPKLVKEDDTTRDVTQEFEGRAKKKKRLAMLLPLLLFFKLKALIVPILLSVLFIKKLLILGAILIPSLLSMVKYCKSSPQVHSFHTSGGFTSGGAGEYSEDYPYYKEYSRRSQNLAYRGYNQQLAGS